MATVKINGMPVDPFDVEAPRCAVVVQAILEDRLSGLDLLDSLIDQAESENERTMLWREAEALCQIIDVLEGELTTLKEVRA